MDDKNLTADQLQYLLEFLPSFEEVRTLRAYKGDREMIGQAEKFMVMHAYILYSTF